MPSQETPASGRGLIPWSTSPAAAITYRLALVATVTAAVFEAFLLGQPGMVTGDHVIIGALIAGMLIATVLARFGKTYFASGTVIGTLWLCAMFAIGVHGIRAAALPSLVMATVLMALWGGAALAVALLGLTCLLLLATGGAFGPILPPPAPTDPTVDTIVVLGQFVFLAVLIAFLSRALRDVRDQFRVREQRLVSATQALAVSRTALEETESRYAELVRALPDLVMVLDEHGRFLEVNDASRDLFGFPAATFTGRKLGDMGILAPQDLGTSYAMLSRALEGETIPAFTVSTRQVDGATRWVEVTGRRLVRATGERRVLVILRDVSERVRSQQELVRRAALWRRASRIAQLGAWEIDLDTGVVTWDDEVRRLHDVPPSFVPDVGSAIRFYAPEARPAIQHAFDTLVAAGTSFSLELPLVTATGRRLFVRAQGEAEERDGKVVKVFGIFHDITALHDATERLRETAKLEGLGRLAGGVAHDFNNLLTAILGYAEEVQGMLAPGTPALEDVIEIRRAGERARELTMQLLAFARRQVVVPRIFDVAAQLRAVQRFLERVVGEDVALRVDAPEGTGAVCMDPVQFEQLLLNLAVNARDAMPGGGALTIRTSHVTLTGDEAAACGLESADCVQVEVEDTGSGMTTEVLQRVFEPFFTTKELGYGTGLGLATVYGLVRQAGGHIAVRSTLGEGTTFIVRLPRVADAAPTPVASNRGEAIGGPETILLVEDDDGVRTFSERVLRQSGYNVRVARSGVEAETLASSMDAAPDLLFSDVIMPGMSGPQLAEQLQRRWPALRTLFASGYTEDRLDTSRLDGATTFLAKPYGRQQLLDTVRSVLDAAKGAAP